MPVIRFGLDEKSISAALKDLKAYQKKVHQLGPDVTKEMTELGVSQAKEMAMYMNAYDSGDLVNGIVAEYKGDKGYIHSTAGHTKFVELGTGIRGKQDPNPNAYAQGWTYDVNEHGEEGWFYIGKDGKRHWTKGMPHRPFLWETARLLRQSAGFVAAKILKGK